MIEIEKEVEVSERTKIRESIRLRREKEKVGAFEKPKVECPECGSRNLVHDYERAELVCNECGLVVDSEFIDQGPEWRAFDHDQNIKRSRVGAPMTYTIHDKGLSTMIDWRNHDSYGKSISLKNRAQLYRLRKWQRRIRISNAMNETWHLHFLNWTGWQVHSVFPGISGKQRLLSTGRLLI